MGTSAPGRPRAAVGDVIHDGARRGRGAAVGALGDKTRHVPLPDALNCSRRLALRVWLASTGHNPEWWPYRFDGAVKPRVVKAPSSALGSGVRHFGAPLEEVSVLE